MDVKLQWKVSPDVDGLVKTVLACKKDLTNACKSVYEGVRVKVLTCDVYAGDKLLQLFSLSELFVPVLETAEVIDESVPESRREKVYTEHVGNFTMFQLHRAPVMGERDVRMVIVMNVDGDSADQKWYGNIELVHE